MTAFFHALSFLTRIPVPQMSSSQLSWEKSIRYYPVIGLMIGICLSIAAYVANMLFPLPVTAVLILVFWIWITGGLHLDGWMDLADGFGSNREKEQMVEIMKDSRVGAFGVIAAILLLLIKLAALVVIISEYPLIFLILPPFIARFFLVIAIWHWPYKSENGVGAGLRNGISPQSLVINSILTVGIISFSVGLIGLVYFSMCLLVGWLFGRAVSRKLEGLTGDCYGALVEWVEGSALLLIFIFWRLWQ